jgi:peroxin-5
MFSGCYKEAAEHFLSALKLQERQDAQLPPSAPGQIAPNTLWETLRRVLIMMERRDLVDQANPGADLSIFRRDFDF